MSAVGCLLLVVAVASTANAQGRGGSPDATLVSPEVSDSGLVTFNIYAPDASQVTVVGDWMTARDPVALRKDAEGVWSTRVGPLNADFYSYTLRVDGVRTLDPRNPMIKQGNTSVDNMFLLPGDAVAYADNQRVPHGEIRQVWYESTTLEMQRRMHIYTPPGYDHNNDDYPVLYLLHGGGDEDSGWSTIGRAGYIIDNLLATNAASPMLVVMPNGSLPQGGDFTSELMNDVIPFIEAHYRARGDSENRAVAGLSMGGLQTTGVFSSHPDEFAYVAIWSAGLFNQSAEEFTAQNREFLAHSERINGNVKLLSVSVGTDDFALPGSESLVDVFNRHSIEHEFNLTAGGHTWLNWRSYLHGLAPELFR